MKRQELKHIAPKLAQIQKYGTGFTYPKGYLDTIESHVFDELYLDNLPKESGHVVSKNYFDNLENNLLSKLQITKNKRSKDSVPDDYFDNLEEVIFARLKKEKKSKVISLKKYWIPAAIAASLLIFIEIYNPFTQFKPIETAEIEAWIDAGYLELNSYEMATIYETEIDDLIIDNRINTENLEDYLIDDYSETIFYD